MRLCGRPGCSEPGAAAYGMMAEDLLFWVAPLDPHAADDVGVLCRRHADAMVVPRGWTLDDLREPTPRLFRPKTSRHEPVTGSEGPVTRRRRRGATRAGRGEQLELGASVDPDDPASDDPASDDPATEDPVAGDRASDTPTGEPAWSPQFDIDSDLDGLLEVKSPLLSRAFRGSGRRHR